MAAPWMRLGLHVVLGAAAVVVALAACSHTGPKVVASSSSPVAGTSTPVVVAAPPSAPLPAPEALIDVLNRLADPNVPGIDKVNLVEGATPDNAGTLDKFTKALRDNGYLPMTFVAKDLAWSDKNPSHVTATVTVNTAQPNNGTFTFPMEFTPFASSPSGWQLSRRTAEMLLALGNSATGSTPAGPAPASPPAPPPAPPAPSPPG